MYYLDNNEYPIISNGSTVINRSWATTNDSSWSILEAALVPKYISDLPVDPKKDSDSPLSRDAYGYGYYSGGTGSYGKERGQVYILVYTFESRKQKNDLIGECSSSAVGPYGTASNYRVAR